MANHRDPNSKLPQYRVPFCLGGAGVIILVLGFIIPGWGWLLWLGLTFAFSAAFALFLWVYGGMRI